MEVMSTPVEMGKKAPPQKNQEAMISSRAAKDVAALLRGPATDEMVTKAQATRRATAWCPALKPSIRLQRTAPAYVPIAGTSTSNRATKSSVTGGDGAPALSARYGAVHSANAAAVNCSRHKVVINDVFRGFRLTPWSISRVSRMKLLKYPSCDPSVGNSVSESSLERRGETSATSTCAAGIKSTRKATGTSTVAWMSKALRHSWPVVVVDIAAAMPVTTMPRVWPAGAPACTTAIQRPLAAGGENSSTQRGR
mmetsp:Transcript_124090/g.386439  ORF Transcript_124090/g.386439 Transcript_124090/m.386439 type:complete len:253 (+) Transcript_124090:381-1139(+)